MKFNTTKLKMWADKYSDIIKCVVASLFITMFILVMILWMVNSNLKDKLKEYESHKCNVSDTIHDTLIIQKDEVKAVLDTQAVFYDIPYDKMSEFSGLWEAVYGEDEAEEPTYSSEKNQKLWQFLRDMFSHDFKPYRKDGVSYSWCIHHMNSNVVCVTNIYLFDWDGEKITIEYGRAKEK